MSSTEATPDGMVVVQHKELNCSNNNINNHYCDYYVNAANAFSQTFLSLFYFIFWLQTSSKVPATYINWHQNQEIFIFLISFMNKEVSQEKNSVWGELWDLSYDVIILVLRSKLLL